MTDYKAKARKYAQQEGLDPYIFQRQIGAESGFNPHAGSPAGAQGIAQIMPGTAKSWGVDANNPDQALQAAARHMAAYVKKYGSYDKALRAYNAGEGAIGSSKGFSETNNYVKRILFNGRDPGVLGKPGSSSVPSVSNIASHASQRGASPGTSSDASGKMSVFDIIERYNDATQPTETNPLSPNGLDEQLQQSNQMLMDAINRQNQPQSSVASLGDTQEVPTIPGSRRGEVIIGSAANRAGAHMDKSIMNFLNDLSTHAGKVTVGTGTNHNQMTVDGNVSDHWDGHAADLPAPIDSRQGDLMAAHALVTAGIPWARAYEMAKKGGLFDVTPESGPYKGHRIQVIWKTNKGGNHHNHVHVGIR